MKTLKKIGLLFCAILFYASVYGQWTQVSSGTNIILHDIFFLDSLTGYCTGGGDMYGTGISAGGILKTNNSGLNWNMIYTDSNLALTEVVAKDSMVMCFGNKNGTPVQLISMDYGNSWNIDTVNFQVADLEILNGFVYFIDSNQLIKMNIINKNKELIKNNVALFDINKDGIIVLNRDVDSIYKSSNGGNSWVSIYLDTFDGFTSVMNSNSLTNASIYFLKDSIVIEATYPTVIVYSHDNGDNWNYITDVDAPVISHISINIIQKPLVLYGSGKDKIFISKNGGISWHFQYKDTINMPRIYSFYSVSDSLIFLCGSNGSIFRTKNGGGTGVGLKENNSLKKKIKIFPNPAKQMIHIETDENIHFTYLILMDNQGKKVREYKKDERELNITGLPSGIYILKLQTKKGEVMEKIVVQ